MDCSAPCGDVWPDSLRLLSQALAHILVGYLLVPAHDILTGTHGGSLDLLNRVAVKPVVSTAQLFGESPGQFYFSYDGHLNPKGSRRVAELLIARENERPSR